MIKWLRRILSKNAAAQPADEPVKPNTGPTNFIQDSRFSVTLREPSGETNKTVDLVRILSQVLTKSGRDHSVQDETLIDSASGVNFRPCIAHFDQKEDLTVRMCTLIHVSHSKIPRGFFEFQHSFGPTPELSATKGFEDWATTDLPVILDALRLPLSECTAVELKMPNGKTRRILFGPVLRWGPVSSEPPYEKTPDQPHPPSCPCCLFFNSGGVFDSFVNSDQFCAIRLLAARNANGSASADCRINGEDYPKGTTALRGYVGTWPATGFEMRKQYVIIQDLPTEKGALP